MRFSILGPLEVFDGDDQIEVPGPKVRALLTVLILNANRAVSTDRLADILWLGEPPTNPSSALQVYVSRLRKALGVDGAKILTRRPGYMLRAAPDEIDVEMFETLANEAAQAMVEGAPAIAATKLRRALGLWRAEAISEIRDHDAMVTEVQRLEEMRIAALEDWIDAELALGNHADVILELMSLVAAHPLRERQRGQLMLALYRSGRQSDALKAYAEARAYLAEELGIDPGVALRELHKQILDHDPVLTHVPPSQDLRTSESGPLPLIGRTEHLLALTETIRLAIRGRKVVVSLEGIAGSGKSRILEEFLGNVERHGEFDVRRAAAFRGNSSSPGSLLADLGLTTIVDRSADEGLPLIVILDDAQWADRASLDLLRGIVIDFPTGILVLLAHRPVEGLEEIPFEQLWDTGRSEGDFVRLLVTYFTQPEIASIIAADDPDEIAGSIIRSTGGLPFRVAELVSFWTDQKAMIRDGNRLVVRNSLPRWTGPPYAKERLEHLAEEERLLVHAVSLARSPVTLKVAIELLDRPRETVLLLAEQLANHGLIAYSGEALLPIHDLAAASVSSDLDESRRSDVLRQLAQATLAIDPADRLSRQMAGAYLLSAGSYEEASLLLAEEALQVAGVEAWAEARPLIEGALAAIKRGAPDPDLEARLRIARASALLFHGFPKEASSDLEKALPHLSEEERIEASTEYTWVLVDSMLIRESEFTFAMTAAAALKLGRVESAMMIYAFQAFILASLGFVQEVDMLCEKIERMLGNDPANPRLEVARAWSGVWMVRGDAVRSERAHREPMNHQASDQVMVHGAPWWYLALLWCGRITEAISVRQRWEKVANRLGNLSAIGVFNESEAEGASLLGRFEQALSAADRAIELSQGIFVGFEHRALYQRARSLAGLDRPKEGWDEIRNAIELCAPGPDGWYFVSMYRPLELWLRHAVTGSWSLREAESLTDELLSTRRLMWTSELLTYRAQIEHDRDLALQAAQIALDIGSPMHAARAAAAGNLWSTPIGGLVSGRLREMLIRIPPGWQQEWLELPEVAPAFDSRHGIWL